MSSEEQPIDATRTDHDTRIRMAQWLLNGVTAGTIPDFTIMARTNQGGRLDYRTPEGPKTLMKAAVSVRRGRR